MRCPKCGLTSGNDWKQCQGSCPIPISPHYDKGRADALTLEQLDEILIKEGLERMMKRKEQKPASGVEPEPAAYKADALPLSYTGKKKG